MSWFDDITEKFHPELLNEIPLWWVKKLTGDVMADVLIAVGIFHQPIWINKSDNPVLCRPHIAQRLNYLMEKKADKYSVSAGVSGGV